MNKGGGWFISLKAEWLKALPQRIPCRRYRWNVHISSVVIYTEQALVLFLFQLNFWRFIILKHSSVKNLWEKSEGVRKRGKLIIVFYFLKKGTKGKDTPSFEHILIISKESISLDSTCTCFEIFILIDESRELEHILAITSKMGSVIKVHPGPEVRFRTESLKRSRRLHCFIMTFKVISIQFHCVGWRIPNSSVAPLPPPKQVRLN